MLEELKKKIKKKMLPQSLSTNSLWKCIAMCEPCGESVCGYLMLEGKGFINSEGVYSKFLVNPSLPAKDVEWIC